MFTGGEDVELGSFDIGRGGGCGGGGEPCLFGLG